MVLPVYWAAAVDPVACGLVLGPPYTPARAFSCRRPRPGPRPDRVRSTGRELRVRPLRRTARSCDRCSVVPRPLRRRRGSSSPRGARATAASPRGEKSSNTPVICRWHRFAPPERPRVGAESERLPAGRRGSGSAPGCAEPAKMSRAAVSSEGATSTRTPCSCSCGSCPPASIGRDRRVQAVAVQQADDQFRLGPAGGDRNHHRRGPVGHRLRECRPPCRRAEGVWRNTASRAPRARRRTPSRSPRRWARRHR